MSIAIVYGSSMGNTESAANIIKDALGVDADLIDIAKTDVETLNGYDKLILGSSTWGDGELQDDWDAFDIQGLDLSNKTVAIFGMGDQESYGDEFCNAIGILYNIAKDKGANIVGSCSSDGYSFDISEAIGPDGNFYGLALDNENEEDMTEERILNWVNIIKADFV